MKTKTVSYCNVHTSSTGIHDLSVYVDPKQIIVCNGSEIQWAALKIENLLTTTTQGGHTIEAIKEEEDDNQITVLEQRIDFVNALDGITDPDLPSDIVKIHCVGNEGYLRKDVHVVVESQQAIHVLCLLPVKQGQQQTFEVEKVFAFTKEFAKIGELEPIRSVSLESYADKENLLVIVKASGESRVMSQAIERAMIEYLASIKQQAEEEDSASEDEEEKAKRAAREAEQRRLWYRMTRVCRRETFEDLLPKRKVKQLTAANQTLRAIRGFLQDQVQANFF